MDQNVFQFLEVDRIEPQKRSMRKRRGSFVEIYHQFNDNQLRMQANRCLACGNPYCEWACPVHNYIPDWLKLAGEGRIIEAAELCHLTNSLPEVCGRICPQDRLCEGACTLHYDYGAVTIGAVEKHIVDTALEMGWRPDLSAVTDTGRQVAVIGAGPAGLGCADVLIRNGVKPVVFDRYPEIGGLLTFGIPNFKLDKKVMARRRKIFTDMGIEFRLNTEVGRDVEFAELMEEYDAVFVGTGAYLALRGELANDDAHGVVDALPFLVNTIAELHDYELPREPIPEITGKTVIVLGGGDTAMDCVRTSVRHGASRVQCVYRRDEANMPGSAREVANARDEGVEFLWNRQPLAITVDDDNRVTGITVARTELSDPDARGRRKPVTITGSEHVLPADIVILAFGFSPRPEPWLSEQGVELDDQNRIVAPESGRFAFQSSSEKIFAGGDAVRGADLVVTAIAEGRQAAEAILDYLGV
jgi:glutamate synthase (NADPH/NADH) small chain